MAHQNNHCFSLYAPLLHAIDETYVLVTDTQLYFRMCTVLRMRAGERCILFTVSYQFCVQLMDIGKNSIRCKVLEKHTIVPLQPHITLYLPVLKKNHLEDAVLFAGKVGVSAIQLIYTERSLSKEPLYERLHAQLVAAAEQSKNYYIPKINAPLLLCDAVLSKSNELGNHMKLACGIGGESIHAVCNLAHKASFHCFVGPEQDWSAAEYQLFANHGIPMVSLGPVVLEASIAAGIVVALVRASS